MGKKINRITDMGTVIQSIFDDSTGTIKVAEAALDWTPIGALGTAVRVDKAASIRVFNSAGTIAYVKFGGPSVTAPSGPSDGIPVPAGQYMVVNSGDHTWIIASAATVYGYQGDLV